jgi:hypothetical protein
MILAYFFCHKNKAFFKLLIKKKSHQILAVSKSILAKRHPNF